MKFIRKLSVIFLAVSMVLGMVGCTNTQKPNANDANQSEKSGFAPVEASKIKIGVLHIGNPSDGAGYSFAHDQGIVAAQKAYGLTDEQIIRKNNVPDDDASAAETAMLECIEAGANIIFATSWGYMDTVEAVAAKYPNVIFSHCSGSKSNDVNFNNYFGRIYQARYLAGIAAGMKTKSNKIGYVAAMDINNSEVTGGINAFAMGVESVNPKAAIFVKVTNTWYDVTKEGQAAEALLDMGCDVIAQHQDTTAPQLAAEKRGVWSCGYNTDMTKDAPKAHLTAPVWDWGAYYSEAIGKVIDGTWKPENYFGGIKDGLVDISPLTENCADGTKEAVEAVKAKIVDGTFKVFEGEITDNKGNVINTGDKVLSDEDITQKMNWYYKNVQVK